MSEAILAAIVFLAGIVQLLAVGILAAMWADHLKLRDRVHTLDGAFHVVVGALRSRGILDAHASGD